MSLSFDIRMKDVDFSRIDVCESEHWLTRLHFNQSYLGRCLIIAKRVSDTSLATCTDDEYRDLRLALQRYEHVLDTAFRPARFNYTQLGNEWPQLHLHAIPRYDKPRRWKHYTITDTPLSSEPLAQAPAAGADRGGLCDRRASAGAVCGRLRRAANLEVSFPLEKTVKEP